MVNNKFVLVKRDIIYIYYANLVVQMSRTLLYQSINQPINQSINNNQSIIQSINK